jgi:hypothetical protein
LAGTSIFAGNRRGAFERFLSDLLDRMFCEDHKKGGAAAPTAAIMTLLITRETIGDVVCLMAESLSEHPRSSPTAPFGLPSPLYPGAGNVIAKPAW